MIDLLFSVLCSDFVVFDVMSTSIVLRDTPSGTQIGEASNGKTALVISQTDSNAYVEIEGVRGWVFKMLLRPDNEYYVRNPVGSHVTMYSSPGAGRTHLVLNGSPVKVLRFGLQYILVETHYKRVGFVHTSQLGSPQCY